MRRAASDVSGYVLAGGKSLRMGHDKALLELAGRPLVMRAVEKLRQVCVEVSILGNREELAAYAPLVRDLHEGCGPLGGIEAALAHSTYSTTAWNLFMAVDMPFLPVGFLDAWVRGVVEKEDARVALFTVDGWPQPALCLVHREVAPFVNGAVERGEFKLFPVLMKAATELAGGRDAGLHETLLNSPWSGDLDGGLNGWVPTEAQRRASHLWFANLNTPDEFAAAVAFTDLLGVN